MFRVFERNYSKFLPRNISKRTEMSSGFSSAVDESCQKLSGKVAVVTGSTEGIGFAIAQRLARDGAKVVVSSRKQTKVDSAVAKLASEGLQVTGIACHVASADDRKKLLQSTLEKNGTIDILISNAGTNPYFGNMLDTPEAAWDKIFEVNVKASFLFTKEVVPIMEKSGGGSIVYVASIAAYQPVPMIGAYSVSKTAILGLTRAMAIECAPMNIRVNCICPGFIKTKFSQAIIDNPDAAEAVISMVPLKRIGEPQECAGIVSFLCSNDASYITGENVMVGGGAFAHL